MLVNDPQWYKDAVIYEVHVRAFCDAVGDGYGDFRGLGSKLDYLQDLGVTAIWLLPFYPSPLRDDGYDIADYTSINPQYGTLEHFREFLDQAHERGIRIITELVLNHTSDQHPWFQRARRAPPGNPERDFYVWSDTPEKYRDARIIFKDFEASNWSYDQLARAYYWHRFYSHQPDLNFDNPAVWQALLPVVDFWFGMGVDGLRLDAVPYLYEREGTNCENLPETHEFLKAIRRHVDENFPNRMLLAEANQWPEDAVAYFGQGDECHMAFHFPVMPRLFMAMHMEDRFPVVDILDQTPAIPETSQWALFLRNHDELTLEMVTDEERDYMYRAFAREQQARVNLGIRHRLAPLLGNNRRRIELMNGLLFSLPGTPVIYYGDEIGMGDNIFLGDRNGVRTPMQWSADRNAGFSRSNPQRLYLPIIIDPEYHYEAINVEAQQNNPSSLLWWMKRLIAQRRQHKAFGRGSIEFLHPENRRILAFYRQFEDEQLLIVANLSRFVQYVELDLAKQAGAVPVELFGGTPFPRITSSPYLLTLAPHSFLWFSLTPQAASQEATASPPPAALPAITVDRDWESLLTETGGRLLEGALRRTFERGNLAGSRRLLRTVRLREWFRLPAGESAAYLALADVEFNRGSGETLVIPVAFASEEEAALWPAGGGPTVWARIDGPKPGVLYDALSAPAYCDALLEAVNRNAVIRGSAGAELVARHNALFSELRGPDTALLLPAPFEQTNRLIRYGNRLILKAYRRIEEGVHPELEMGRLLAEVNPPPAVAPLAGSIEYRRRRSEMTAVATVHGYVPNEGDGLQYSLDVLSAYFERVTTLPALESPPTAPLRRRLLMDGAPPPDFAMTQLQGYLEMVKLLGKRLGELHQTLASASDRPEFIPEPIALQYQRAVYQAMRNVMFDVLNDLETESHRLPDDLRDKAAEVQKLQPVILKEFRGVADRRIHATRIRCHGDCHLHQVLFTGKDFVFIDFEGRPRQSVGERRIKRSPFVDVTMMVRSFDYAAYAALFGLASGRGRTTGVVRDEDRPALIPWARAWRGWTHHAFLEGWLQVCEGSSFLPNDSEERNILFRVHLIDQILLEIARQLRSDPAWLPIPLLGLLEAFEAPSIPVSSPVTP
jgi:maltose alpha-D-glucosyltransferase/alpha-amylase